MECKKLIMIIENINVTVNIKTKKIILIKLTDDHIRCSQTLPKLVKKSQSWPI